MSFQRYINESNFNRIITMLRGDVPSVDTVGIITAFNPLGLTLSTAENKRRNKQLLQDLKAAHFTSLKVGPRWIMGKFGGAEEDSWLVPHITREALIEFAGKYGQKVVIWGKKDEKSGNEGNFMRFEWIATTQGLTQEEIEEVNKDKSKRDEILASVTPIPPQTYETVEVRDVVITNKGVIGREDYYSSTPYPRSGVDKRKTPPEKVQPRKFVIPFFEPEYEPQEEYYNPHVSFVESELPNSPEIKTLVGTIRREHENLQLEGLNSKHYWQVRGQLNSAVQKLAKMLSSH